MTPVARSGASTEDAVGIAVGYRIWLHRGGRPAVGMGTFELLGRVESTGSLSRAAADMGMAYSKAWQSVRRAEEMLGFALLDRQAGGRGGGGSTLSTDGKWLVGAFGELAREAAEAMGRLGEKHFGGDVTAGRNTGSVAAGPR
jgi:molybdate transport system regulatory protein